MPAGDRLKLFDWSNQMTSYDDPDIDIDPQAASMEILGCAYPMGDERRKCPADDIDTRLIKADIDGNELSPEEFGVSMILPAVTGNETTRSAITHGMIVFLDNPD
ncbi:cytochrome P450 [Rhodococcus sp. 27YEA15]